MSQTNFEIFYMLQPFTYTIDYHEFMTNVVNGYMSDKIFSKVNLEKLMFKDNK